MRVQITEQELSKLTPRDKPIEMRDDKVRGFLARMQPSGGITFFLEYRNKAGKKQRLKLGRYGDITAAQARTMAEQVRAEITLGADPAKEKRENRQDLTLGDFLKEHYEPWATDNLKSANATITRLRSGFVPLLKKRLADLDHWQFEKHRSRRLKHKLPKARKLPTPATVNRDFAHMRAALSKAVQWRMVESNPLSGLKKSREDRNQSIRALSTDEEAAIMAAFAKRRADRQAEHDKINARRRLQRRRELPEVERYLSYFEPLVVVAIQTGLRRGELFNLEWSDIDLKAAALTVQGAGAKSHQTRVVPLTDKALDALTTWKDYGEGTGLVFPSKYGGGRLTSIKGAWVAILADAGIEGIRFHDLRHTFGTRLAQAGAPVTTIQRLMGHSSIVTTSRYLHATSKDAQDAIALLNGTDK